MMPKYIYHTKELRCRIKPTGYENQLELQIQKRKYFIWWNVYVWMHVKEGFWGECEKLPVLRSSYSYGNICESYMTGTLDLNKRAKEFFKEYFQFKLVQRRGRQLTKYL